MKTSDKQFWFAFMPYQLSFLAIMLYMVFTYQPIEVIVGGIGLSILIDIPFVWIMNKNDVAERKNQPIGKIAWLAKLEEPSEESGSSEIRFELPIGSTVQDVKDELMKLKLFDGSQRFYEQDVNPPYLHFIRKLN
jgi:hypothetical protein